MRKQVQDDYSPPPGFSICYNLIMNLYVNIIINFAPENNKRRHGQISQFCTTHCNSPRTVATQVLRNVHTIRTNSDIRHASAEFCRSGRKKTQSYDARRMANAFPDCREHGELLACNATWRWRCHSRRNTGRCALSCGCIGGCYIVHAWCQPRNSDNLHNPWQPYGGSCGSNILFIHRATAGNAIP